VNAPRRLFVGIELNDSARTACTAAAESLQRTGFAARYDDAAKLHVTLAFLGNVEPMRSTGVVETLLTSVAWCEPFCVTLDKVSAFPHEVKPRIVYVGARNQGPDFRALARSVRESFENQGFAFDRDPIAHVTIARIKNPSRPLPLVEIEEIPLAVAEIALFESHFDKVANTSRFEIVARAPLRLANAI
jgi:2'-5' RNA ligase